MKAERQPEENHLYHAVKLRRARRRLFEHFGDRSLMRSLAALGSLGWLLVAPTLLGVLFGRWLDRTLGSGVFWSASLIILGAIAGMWLVWQRLEEERKR